MLRLRAFRPTNDKIVKIQLHPTHPWLVTADASDRVSVWNWEHRQVSFFQFCCSCFCFLMIYSQLFICQFRLLPFLWVLRQVIYELKAGGVDERRLVGAKLEKLAEGESGETRHFRTFLFLSIHMWICISWLCIRIYHGRNE